VVYLLYFSGQAAMIVRNYLVAAPFFFVLMARGIFWTKSKLPWKKARIGFAIGVLLLIGANALDQAKAAASVARRNLVRPTLSGRFSFPLSLSAN